MTGTTRNSSASTISRSSSPICDVKSPYRLQATGFAQKYHLHHLGSLCSEYESEKTSSSGKQEGSHRSRDHEAAKEIPKGVDRGRNDGRDIVVGRDGGGHHPEEGEVEDGAVHEEQEEEELHERPLEGGQRVEYAAVN